MQNYDNFTREDIDNFSDINFVSLIVLKFVGVSSKHLRIFLESLRESSEIFGHLREFSEIHGKCSGTFVWPSEIFGKSSKTPSSVSLNNKQNNTWTLGDMEFIFSCSHSISHSFAVLTLRYRCDHSKINSISPRDHVLFSIYITVSCLHGVSFQRNCGAASVGVLQDYLVLSTGLIM